MVIDKLKDTIKKSVSVFYRGRFLFQKKFFFRLFKKKIGALKNVLNNNLIVGTKNGLFVLIRDEIFQVLQGHFYGITFFENKIYVFEKLGEQGRIIRFNKNIKSGDKFEVVIDGLSPGCHQIDFIQDKLHVTDTYNNRILVFTDKGVELEKNYPLGRLDKGRKSKNYGHINSIYFHNGLIHLICHNESEKTGKRSELLKLNKKFKVLEKIKLNASSAHNVVIINHHFYICDSLNSKLIVNNKEAFKCDLFTRGLAIFNDLIIVGGSEYAKRENREYTNGAIYILNSKFDLLEKVKMPAMIQEIRGLNPHDLSLSNS